MKAADHPLLQPHIGKPAVLDSNLLLLLWCAEFDRSLVTKFKRLSAFVEKDIELLFDALCTFSVLRTTPHVLTEVSNLANALPQGVKSRWCEHFADRVQVIPEEWIPAAKVARGGFMWLGLTDAALAELASTHVVLTLDFPLSNSLESRGLNVINFTHLRSLWLD